MEDVGLILACEERHEVQFLSVSDRTGNLRLFTRRPVISPESICATLQRLTFPPFHCICIYTYFMCADCFLVLLLWKISGDNEGHDVWNQGTVNSLVLILFFLDKLKTLKSLDPKLWTTPAIEWIIECWLSNIQLCLNYRYGYLSVSVSCKISSGPTSRSESMIDWLRYKLIRFCLLLLCLRQYITNTFA